jgi:hypothetical protein
MVLGTAAPALAHDCFVVNRSTRGTDSATRSGRWFQIDINAAVAGCGGSEEEIAQVDAALEEAGLPLVFDTFTNGLLPDTGHGIQHIDETYIPIIFGIVSSDVATCLEQN